MLLFSVAYRNSKKPKTNRREPRAIFTVARKVVFSLCPCGFQRNTIINTTAISHTMKQMMRVSVTLSRCFVIAAELTR
jgi:hypothetical protein